MAALRETPALTRFAGRNFFELRDIQTGVAFRAGQGRFAFQKPVFGLR
jgi:hypothetical protein